jgi:hypothetical protein
MSIFIQPNSRMSEFVGKSLAPTLQRFNPQHSITQFPSSLGLGLVEYKTPENFATSRFEQYR